ncbi:hypothetical protein O0L34_g6542 [Tuta absoluta]|nr:hypothetical protein O0L34_g6542 [Tuta absoluta]
MEKDRKVRCIPKSLKFGVATAAFQIEGAWNVADKTPSIWDTYCHLPNKIKDGTTGDDACKSYHFFKRDIEMLKILGVDFYRFSISWPRMLPNGFANKISADGTAYYNNLINALIENGIEPVVTMFHWDLPQKLQDLGGWANPLISDWFEDYARVLFSLFGDRVKIWVTINEPKQIGLFGYGYKRFAPALNAQGIGEYLAAKNIVMAHAKAWRLYDKEFREMQMGRCGITIATDFREAASDSPQDIEAGLDAMEFEVGMYAHPIFSEKGGFPDRLIERVDKRSAEQGFPRSRLPEFTEQEKELVKGTSDFYGFNHYSTKFYSREQFSEGMFPIPSYDDDICAAPTWLHHRTAPIVHCTPIPEGIRKALNWVKNTYNNPEIFITENGYGNFGGTDDFDRVSYYMSYLDAVLDAIEIDGCNVTRYTCWSLMDNFEWDSGLSAKFGLFEIDFKDDERKYTARLSANWYSDLLRNRILDHGYEQIMRELQNKNTSD